MQGVRRPPQALQHLHIRSGSAGDDLGSAQGSPPRRAPLTVARSLSLVRRSQDGGRGGAGAWASSIGLRGACHTASHSNTPAAASPRPQAPPGDRLHDKEIRSNVLGARDRVMRECRRRRRLAAAAACACTSGAHLQSCTHPCRADEKHQFTGVENNKIVEALEETNRHLDQSERRMGVQLAGMQRNAAPARGNSSS